MSPAVLTPPDPLGLNVEGDESKFPEEELHELFPDGSGNLQDENFQPGWYLLEHHSNTSFEDLKIGALYLQRKVESQKEGQLSFLKANTGTVMDELDRLVTMKTMMDEDKQCDKASLLTLQTAIEDSIKLSDTLFSEILLRKEKADKTRAALTLLTRHKFLFQLPSSIDSNIKKKEYDLVVNDYSRVKNLFGKTDIKLFQKILAQIDKKIEDLKEKLHERIVKMPISIQEQRKLIRLLISLSWEGDAAWDAITSRKEYLITLLNKVKEHYKEKDHQEKGKDSEKAKRKSSTSTSEGQWSGVREWWCGVCCAAVSSEVCALWTVGRWYFAGELAGEPSTSDKQELFKQMIITGVELFAEHMRGCLLSGNGVASAKIVRSRLVDNLRHLRETFDCLLKVDLPSQPLAIIEKVIFNYRVHGMTTFLQMALKNVKNLSDMETWKIEEFSDYGAITKLPSLLEIYINDALSCIHGCVVSCGRRETTLFAPSSEPAAMLHKHIQQILLAYVTVLENLALNHMDEEFSNNSLSVALNLRLDDMSMESADTGRTWQQRLLITGANAQYTRRVTLNKIITAFDGFAFPKPTSAIQATKEALTTLESSIVETYLEHKGDPLVGTIEPSMYMGRYKLEPDAVVDDARPYVYEIINNLIAVHAEVDSVCGNASSRYVRDICETVCEELARLASCAPSPMSHATAFRARLEYTLLHLAIHTHLSRKAEGYLTEALASLPPLEAEGDVKRMEKIVTGFKKKMELQLASLNCNTEIV